MPSQNRNTSPADVINRIAARKAAGDKVVFTNGCFDILHVGHVRYLEQARSLGDMLVIGLNSDDSVKKLKGDSRPVIPEDERREVLLALKPVDEVIIFGEETPLRLITELKPNVLVKGGDWSVDQIVGGEVVSATGGTVHSLPYVPGKSTTEIIKRIEKL